MANLRYSSIRLALKAMAATRIDRLAAKRLAGAGVILTFHHVRAASDRVFRENRLLEITPDFLDQTIRLLRDLDYDIIPLDALPERLSQGGPRFAVLTFDDGYRDLRDEALPVLRRRAAPFTLFVTTGFADRSAPLWWLDLEDAARANPKIEVDLPDGRFIHPADTPEQRQAGFSRLYWRLRDLPEAVVRDIVARMAAGAGVDSIARVARLCLDWDGLRAIAREPLATIGAHSLTHPRLATLDAEASRTEIAQSKARIEREIGVEVRHFAYPVGDVRSASSREFAFVREAGFETAVTTRPGMLFPEHAGHPFALPRVSVNGLFQEPQFLRVLLSGLPTALAQRGRRLDVD